MTVKPCSRPAVRVHRLGWMEFIDVFSFILTLIMLGLLFQVVHKQTLGKVRTKTLI